MSTGDFIFIDLAYRESLRAASLDRVDAILRRVDGRVVAWSRTTETMRVDNPAGEVGFYLKRYFYPHWPNRLRGALRGTLLGAHRGRAEFQLLAAMRRLGLPAVRPVAYGSRRVLGFVSACFLITEEVPGAENLTTAASASLMAPALTFRQRRQLARTLAHQVAHLHETGFRHGQLFWRNLLIRFGPVGDPEFFFLDARPRRGRLRLRRSRHWWMDELAQLAASAMPFSTRCERLAFLHEYFEAKKLSPEVKQVAHQLERLAARWRRHEDQRIKMNELFQLWNRQLRLESAPGRPAASAPGAAGVAP